MLATTLLLILFAATGLAQTLPEGYRAVYLVSNVDKTFAIAPKTPVKSGTTLVVQKTTNKIDQQWYLKSGNSTIQLANTTLCVDAGAKTNWKDMAALTLLPCTTPTTPDSQTFNVMADGRIALAASSPQECFDLQYMRATVNNPVGLYACAGLNNAGAGDKGINWPQVNVTATPTVAVSFLG